MTSDDSRERARSIDWHSVQALHAALEELLSETSVEKAFAATRAAELREAEHELANAQNDDPNAAWPPAQVHVPGADSMWFTRLVATTRALAASLNLQDKLPLYDQARRNEFWTPGWARAADQLPLTALARELLDVAGFLLSKHASASNQQSAGSPARSS